MSIDADKVIERSVDSIAKIYAVVIALAIAQSIQTLIKDPNGGADLRVEAILSGTPAFVAFLFTLVPFWHGMNRHLDRCYLEKASVVAQGALLFDFVAFFLEAGLLFAAGWSLRTGIATFYCLGILLATDMIWGYISHLIHFPGRKSHVLKWSIINVAAGALAFGVVEFPFKQKPWVLMAIAILRSIADYKFCWKFYFPISGAEQKEVSAGSTLKAI
jgi:hypothetical protein